MSFYQQMVNTQLVICTPPNKSVKCKTEKKSLLCAVSLAVQNVKLSYIKPFRFRLHFFLFLFLVTHYQLLQHKNRINMVTIARMSSYLTNQTTLNESGPLTLGVKDINTSGGQWYVV